MNFDEYKNDGVGAINASSIKKGVKSLLKMRLAMSGQKFPDSPSMRWGRICHSAILEPARFQESLKVCDLSKNSNAWKAIIEGATNPDTILTTAELEKVTAMRGAFMLNKDAQEIVKDMTFEFTLRWTSETYGAAKARADGIKKSVILEYKTVKNDASERSFFQTITKLSYDLAAGWYHHGAKQCAVVNNPSYIFIVQEAEAPYEVAVYEVPKTMLEIGYAKAEAVAKRYRECERTGMWTGIQPGGMKVLDLADWYVGGADLVGDIEAMDMEGDE